MSTDNAQLENMQKAITAADALATTGKLNPKQADKFLDWVIDVTGLKDQVRMVKFSPETMQIEKIAVGERVAMLAEEARDPQLRRGVTTSKITLRPVEFMVPFEISQRFTEINIEGGSIEDHIVRMMATQAANNFEELYINANPLGPAIDAATFKGGDATKYVKDTYLGALSGWSLLADSGHIVDGESAPMNADFFSQAIQALPIKYRRGLSDMRVLMAPDMWQIYLAKTATRMDAAGTAALTGGAHNPFGLKVLPIPLWAKQPRQVEHVVLNGTTEVDLKSTNISNVVVLPSTLSSVETTPYVLDTDYAVDLVTGKINRIGGAIADGATVKVTYDAAPQMILTHKDNLIIGFGRNITLERDRDIYRRVNQYALHMAVDVTIQNADAVVKVKNIGI